MNFDARSYANDVNNTLPSKRKSVKLSYKDAEKLISNRGTLKSAIMNQSTVKSIMDNAVEMLTEKFFIKITCQRNSTIQYILRCWIAKHDPTLVTYCNINSTSMMMNIDEEEPVSISGADYSNIIRISKNGWMYYRINSINRETDLGQSFNQDNVVMYLFGKDMLKNRNRFISIMKRADRINSSMEKRRVLKDNFKSMLYMYWDDHSFCSTTYTGEFMTRYNISLPNLSELYLSESALNTIDLICKNNADVSNIYSKYHKVDRKTVLLYGVPGTGKTSIAISLAVKMHKSIIIMDATVDKNDFDEQCNLLFNGYTRYNDSIILLEEIDQLFTERNIESTSATSNVLKDGQYKINTLMQSLSGARTGLSQSKGQIVIMTTNYIDKLDKAFIRDGRFDYKICVDNINESQAKSMVEDKFECKWEDIKPVLTVDQIGRFNPANVENMCIQNLISRLNG